VLDEQHRAGWSRPSRHRARGPERTLGRIDAYPIGTVSRRHAHSGAIRQRESPAQALAQLMAERISSLYVRPAEGDPMITASETGIITERDVCKPFPVWRRCTRYSVEADEQALGVIPRTHSFTGHRQNEPTGRTPPRVVDETGEVIVLCPPRPAAIARERTVSSAMR